MKWILSAIAGFGALGLALIGTPPRTGHPPGEVATIVRAELIVRSSYQGHLESRHVVSVASRFEGQATVIELAPEGSRVVPGDLLVQFDTADESRAIVEARTNVTLRSAELEALIEAEHPVQLLELSQQIEEARRLVAAESEFLEISLELAVDDLVSPAELAAQRTKVAAAAERLAALERRLQLTRDHAQPLERRRAQALVEAALSELARVERQMASATLLSPSSGVVVYQPIHIDGELRPARVGDGLYANQPFLLILDFSDLVVRMVVPESERSAVAAGNPVLVQPLANAGAVLHGEVEQISDLALPVAGYPAELRYFRATVRLLGQPSGLRPGMSVIAQVVTYHAEDAIVIPRRAVRFVDGRVSAEVVRSDGSTESRDLALGQASECCFEIADGVAVGERVRLW